MIRQELPRIRRRVATLWAGHDALLAVVLLAYALRLYHLNAPSLRGDESFAINFAGLDWPALLRHLQTSEPHPPLYYAGLKLWLGLAGASDYAARYLSLLCGVLAVALTMRLAFDGGRRGGSKCAVRNSRLVSRPLPERDPLSPSAHLPASLSVLVAGLAVAANPFLLWYAQDARMYAPYVALALLACVLELRALQGRLAFWPGGLAAAALGLVHYSGLLYVLALAVAGLAWLLLTGGRQRLGGWLAARGLTALLLAPWLLFAAGILGQHTSDWLQPATLGEMVERLWRAASAGVALEGLLVPALLLWLALAGYALWRRPGLGLPTAWLAVALFLPPILTWLLSLNRPAFDERYLIPVFPLAAVLLVLPLTALPGRLVGTLVPLALALWLATPALAYLETRPREGITDWRGLAARLLADWREGDLLILNYPDPTLEFYLRGRIPVHILPSAGPLDPARTDAELAALGTPERIWLVPVRSPQWDPDGYVAARLARTMARTATFDGRGYRLERYEPVAALARRDGRPLGASFGDVIELTAYRTDVRADETGRTLLLRLYWRALAAPGRDVQVFNHVVRDDQDITQRDGPPAGPEAPTSRWAAGDWHLGVYAIPLPAGADPAGLRLQLGLYSLENGQRLSVRLPNGATTDHVDLPVQ